MLSSKKIKKSIRKQKTFLTFFVFWTESEYYGCL